MALCSAREMAREANEENAGALSLDLLQQIIVDASHMDQKKRGVMDMKDTMLPLARFLTRQEFKDRYAADEKTISLLFY